MEFDDEHEGLHLCSIYTVFLDFGIHILFFSNKDIYGVSPKPNLNPTSNGSENIEPMAKKTKTVMHLSLRDFISGHGPTLT